ncbi:MAG: hypothetical protein K2Q20_14590, partial [Phycisphaerales bacterium]|nr:hypothetical protein [Phycisphaerales bacterium]
MRTRGCSMVALKCLAAGLALSLSAPGLFAQELGKGQRVQAAAAGAAFTISRFHPASDDPSKYPPSIA